MKFTKSVVDAAAKSNKDNYLWDQHLKGFGLKVTPSGRKVYILQYRMGGRGNKTRRITMGVHGSNLTTEQARKLAQKYLGQIASGVDPLAEKDASKKELSVQQAFVEFDAKHISVKLKQETAKDYRRIFNVYIFPRFKNISVKKISKQDVLQLHHDLRDTPYRANCVIRVLSKFFNWCEQHEYRDEYTNPIRFIQKYKETPRQRFLSQEEQKRLWETLEKTEVDNLASPYAVNAIRLLSLTGARLREILDLKWEFVDLENGLLNLPDSKTGKKTIYLNPPSINLLRNVVRQKDNPYVLCGLVEGKPINNLQKPWRRIRGLAGLEGVRIHDLRHTFASVAVMGGMSLPMIGALLGHSRPETTARYAHLAADPLKEASSIIAAQIVSS